jgi:RNA polymerase sigma factor (sigma-70 family)
MTAQPATSAPSQAQLRSLTTDDLVRAARGGDPHAWGELVSRYQSMVRSVVRPFRLLDADHADTVQNTWVRAIERIHTLRDPERLGGWLTAIARREALATLRRSGREVPVAIDSMELPAREPGPESTLLTREARHAVAGVVAALPPRRRAFVYALFYQPEPSYSEISQTLVMPTGSIGPTRQRVLCTLRTGLADRGFGASMAV